jgi:putative MFS transporter
MLFGMLAILSGILVRWLLPESLRYLENKGHFEAAQKEADRVRLFGDHLVPVEPDPIAGATSLSKQSRNGIWSKKFARTTFSIWLLWFSLNFLYQGIFIWLPTLLAGESNATSRSFLITLIISLGQIPGTLLVAYVADKFSRKKLIIFSLGLLGLATLIFPLSSDTVWIIIFGFLIMIFNGMAWGLAHPFSAELYPTSIRGSATGWGTGVGRLGGVLAPMLVAWLIQLNGSIMSIFTVLAAAPVVTIVILAGLKQETTGRSLEEITDQN